MPSVNAPFGFQPVYHNSGIAKARAYTIASAYAGNIFKGDPVKLVDGGTIEYGTSDGTGTGTVDGIGLLGIFAGCEFTDANGKPTYSAYWPGGTTATNIVAYVWDDPETVFRVQNVGTLTVADIGEGTDFTVLARTAGTGGSTATGLSLSTATAVVATSGQFQIIGLDGAPNNAWSDTYVITHVRINEHHYKAAVNSI